MTTATAEWWMVAVLSGALTILGGIVGGLISFLSSYFSDMRKAARDDVLDERKHQREIARRWDLDVRRLGAELLMISAHALDASYAALEKAAGTQQESSPVRRPRDFFAAIMLENPGPSGRKVSEDMIKLASITDVNRVVIELRILAPGELADAAADLANATTSLVHQYLSPFNSEDDSEFEKDSRRAEELQLWYDESVENFTERLRETLQIEATGTAETSVRNR